MYAIFVLRQLFLFGIDFHEWLGSEINNRHTQNCEQVRGKKSKKALSEELLRSTFCHNFILSFPLHLSVERGKMELSTKPPPLHGGTYSNTVPKRIYSYYYYFFLNKILSFILDFQCLFMLFHIEFVCVALSIATEFGETFKFEIKKSEYPSTVFYFGCPFFQSLLNVETGNIEGKYNFFSSQYCRWMMLSQLYRISKIIQTI